MQNTKCFVRISVPRWQVAINSLEKTAGHHVKRSVVVKLGIQASMRPNRAQKPLCIMPIMFNWPFYQGKRAVRPVLAAEGPFRVLRQGCRGGLAAESLRRFGRGFGRDLWPIRFRPNWAVSGPDLRHRDARRAGGRTG